MFLLHAFFLIVVLILSEAHAAVVQLASRFSVIRPPAMLTFIIGSIPVFLRRNPFLFDYEVSHGSAV